MTSNNVYLIGASGHAKVITDILISEKRSVIGVFDKNPEIVQMLNYDVRPQPDDNWPAGGEYLIAIGSNKIRKRLAEAYKEVLYFTTAIHPQAVISGYAKLDKGTVVMAGAVINADTMIGRHVILNTGCTIDHDCRIADYVHISPQAGLAGDVEVGEGTHIGIGASVIQGIKIGKWATIGAGTVIIRDVPDYAVVVGNPGRVIKYNNPSK